MIVNNKRDNVAALPYDDHDRAVKLLHSLDNTVWSEKVEAILESGSMRPSRWTSFFQAQVARGGSWGASKNREPD
jgi:hypothetical protein